MAIAVEKDWWKKKGQHFPFLVGLFCLGSVISSFFPSVQIWKISALISLGLWPACKMFTRKPIALFFLEAICFFCLGGWNYQRVLDIRALPEEIGRSLSNEEHLLEGLVIEAPEIRPSGVRFPLLVEKVVSGNRACENRTILVTVKEGGWELKYGDRVRTRLKLRVPEPPGNPGNPDWSGRLLRKGIQATGIVENGDGILVLGRAKGNFLLQKMEDLRWELASTINWELPSPAKGLLLALITGHSSAVDRELRDSFSSLGLSHVLAISGLHFGLVVLWVHGVLRLVAARIPALYLFYPMDKILWIGSLPFLLAYAAIAGAAPSVKRALLMVLAVSLAFAIGRTRKLYHALALSALIILLWDPREIMELSFQLSFVSVMGLLYFLPHLVEWLRREDALTRLEKQSLIRLWTMRLALGVGTTIAATIATFPIVINNFHLVPMLAVPANLLIVPVAGWVVLPLALAASFLVFVWEMGGMELLWVAAWISDWIVRACTWLASWAPKVYLPSLRPWEIAAFYLSLIALGRLRKSRWAAPLLVCSICSFPIAWSIEWIHKKMDRELKVHFISVGNGACTFVETPEGKSLLIDGGGSHDPSVDLGSLLVAPVLWENRLASVHRIVLTHPHPDHMNGLSFILKAFKVKEGVWDNGDRPLTPDYFRFWEAAIGSGWEPQPLCAGSEWNLGAVHVEFLHPPCNRPLPRGTPKSRMANEISLVVKISIGKVSFLIPSDIGKETEAHLAASGKVRSTVLMVPHHGSRTSSSEAFLKAVEPLFAVFSSQAGPKGLAQPELKAIYDRLGIESFHTGEDGMVSFSTDGESLEVQTYLSRKKNKLKIE